MVSFSCEGCGDVLTKKKLDGHRNQCYGASFSCLDCMVHFQGTTYRSHTACITEDQKYQGKLYKEKKPKGQHQKKDSTQHDNSQALTPHNAYVEDAPETDNAVALVDAPPRAPTPPPAAHSLGYHEHAALPPVNVFDFLEASQTPNVSKTQMHIDESRMLEDSQPPAYEEERYVYTEEQQMPSITNVMNFQVPDDDDSFAQNGFTYGDEPIRPSKERYDSYATPAPKTKHSRTKSRDTDVETTTKKTDRKRKRNSPTQLDMSLVRAQEQRDVMMADAPMLHSGLTGGLNRLLARPEFPPSPEDSGDYANSPLSPMKRAKQGNSKALLRAQREWELQEQKQRKAAMKEERAREQEEKKEKERGRDRDRKDLKASTALVKIRPKKRRDESVKETRRLRRRQYSSSVSPAPRERKPVKAIEYHRSGSRSPDGNGQLIVRSNRDIAPIDMATDARADLFMSFITKGPESERGMSVNKALKRYHRERCDRRDREPSKSEEEKELWKNLRLKRNDRGEVVLFFAVPETS